MEEVYTCECKNQHFIIYFNKIKCVWCGMFYAVKPNVTPEQFNSSRIGRKLGKLNDGN